MVGWSRSAAASLAAAACLAVAAAAACAGPDAASSDVRVHDVRVAESVNGETMAVYARIENRGAADALIALRPGLAAEGSLHEMSHDGGMMTMRAVERIELAAGSTVELRPGSWHGMLEGMDAPPLPGDIVQLTFAFAFAPPVTVAAPVFTMAEIAAGEADHRP